MAAWKADPLAKKITYTVGGFGIAVGLFEVKIKAGIWSINV